MGRLRHITHTNDSNFLEVVKHTVWAMFLLGITTVVQFIFDFLLTHRFGAHGAGTFYLSFSVLLTLSLIGRLGLDQAVIRYIPPLLKKPARALGVHTTAARLSLLISLPLAVLWIVLAPTLANDVFHETELTRYFITFAVVLPIFSLNYVYGGVLRALKKSGASLVMARFGYYLIGIIGLLTLGRSFGISGVVIGFSFGIVLATLYGLWVIRKRWPLSLKAVPFSKKKLLITSLPLLFVIFATQMNGQTSVLILGAVSSSSDVAIYNIALKVSMLMGIILAAISTVAATKITELYYANKREQLNILVSKISALGTALSLPTFTILVAFAPFWMGLFGHKFEAGSTALILLAAGQLINVSVGTTNFMLGMTGHERALAVAIGSSLVLNIILGLILIPAHGVNGAAIATGAANAFGNIMMVLMVKHYMGVWSLPFKSLGVWLQTVRSKS